MAESLNFNDAVEESSSSDSSFNYTPANSENEQEKRDASPKFLNELLALFECSVCFELMVPPIMQCQRGHLVCKCCCRRIVLYCPTCRGVLGMIRNLAMEKIATSIMFPCRYISYGCNLNMPLTLKIDHEEICEFHPYTCPIPGGMCCWEGKLDGVMNHLERAHPNIITFNGDNIVHVVNETNLDSSGSWIIMQSCYDHNFMLVLQRQELNHQTYFFAIIQLIGNKEDAKQFTYRLEVYGNNRRMVWDAKPKSCHEGVKRAIRRRDCLVFDKSSILHFIKNGHLDFEVSIFLA